jgi:hypothetical protein
MVLTEREKKAQKNSGALGLIGILGGQRQVSDCFGVTGTGQMDLQASSSGGECLGRTCLALAKYTTWC